MVSIKGRDDDESSALRMRDHVIRRMNNRAKRIEKSKTQFALFLLFFLFFNIYLRIASR